MTDTPEMVERVARAMYYSSARNRPYDRLEWHARGRWEERARAAIEAMREPTLAMRKVARFEVHEVEYKAMIDAALS